VDEADDARGSRGRSGCLTRPTAEMAIRMLRLALWMGCKARGGLCACCTPLVYATRVTQDAVLVSLLLFPLFLLISRSFRRRDFRSRRLAVQLELEPSQTSSRDGRDPSLLVL